MKRIVAAIVGISALAGLAACSESVPPPAYSQNRAIDQDIEATHVVGPTVTSPAFTQRDPNAGLTPWANEEMIDQQKVEQTGELPQH